MSETIMELTDRANRLGFIVTRLRKQDDSSITLRPSITNVESYTGTLVQVCAWLDGWDAARKCYSW